MAPRTLASTWKTFEKLTKEYEGASPPKHDEAQALNELAQKTNSSRIVDALASLFVQGYQGLEEVNVQFYASRNGDGFPAWPASYLEHEGQIVLNPLGILRFRKRCHEAVKAIKTPEGRDSFVTYRFQAYLSELRKLPTEHLIFPHLLNQVAKASQITRVEKKGGGIEEVEDEQYMTLLWAFKELDLFFKQSNGRSLRSEYSILWYESDWILGKK